MRGFISKAGVAKQLTQKTPYHKSRNMVLVCPICGARFHRPPSHVARVKVSYCGRGCQAEGHKARVIVPCVTCGKEMSLTPSKVGRVTTCSKECSTVRRVKDPQRINKGSFAAYRKAALEISNRGLCETCGAVSGPWSILGLEVIMSDDGRVDVDSSRARLLCRTCHLSEVGRLGPPARVKLYGR